MRDKVGSLRAALPAALPVAFTAALWGVLLACPAGSAVAGARDPAADAAPAVDTPDPTRTRAALVVEVIDGDSLILVVDGEPARFEVLGADTPEWVARSTQRDPDADAARAFLTRMLLSERVRILEPEPGVIDAVGRRRAYVFREPDGLFVDLEIVRLAYGRVSTRAGAPFERVLRWYERRARELARGVWARGTPDGETSVVGSDPGAASPAEVTPASATKPVIPAPEPTPDADPKEEPWVWITRSGDRYHREDCQHLGPVNERVSLDEVRSTHFPCKSCDPDG